MVLGLGLCVASSVLAVDVGLLGARESFFGLAKGWGDYSIVGQLLWLLQRDGLVVFHWFRPWWG